MDRRIKPRIRKYILLVALVSVFCLVGIVPAFAAESDLSEAEAAYSELYDALDDETEEALEEIGVTDILVYTGYTLEELGREFGELAERILSRVTVLVDGEFRKELRDEVPLRGSSNQRVIVLDEAYRREYEEYMRQERRVDVFGFAHETHFIGIPPEDYDRLYAGLIKSEGQR